MPPGSRCLRQRGAGDAHDLRAVPEGARPAARRGLGDRDEQELRPDGRQQAPGVRRPVLRQRRAPEAAADRDDQVRREHRSGARRRRSAGARRAHDAGARRRIRRVRVEGVRVGPHAWDRAEGEPREIAARLLQRSDGPDERRRADVLHDQGDHEPSRAVAAGRELLGHRHRALRRVLALPRGDPKDRSSRARAVAARAVARRSTAIARRSSWSPSSDGMATWSETGSRTTAAATSPAGGCGSWRLAPACPRAPAPNAPSGRPTSPRRWREFSGSRCRSAKAGRSRSWRSDLVDRSDAVRRTIDRRRRGAGAGARGRCSRACRRPCTRSSSWSFRSGRRCSRPSSGISARCSITSRRLPRPELQQAVAGIARVETRGRLRQDRAAAIPAGSRTTRRRCCESGGSCRRGGRKSTASSSRSTPALDARALSPGCSPSARGPDLRQRHRHPGGQAVEPLQGDRRSSAADARGRAGIGRISPGAVWRARQRRHGAGAVCGGHGVGGARLRWTPGSSNLTKRCTTCATRHCVPATVSLDRLELRPPARRIATN